MIARTFLVAALAMLSVTAARSQDPAADGEKERTRIKTERARIEATMAQEEQACQARFAVTDCLNGVRKRWRAPLADLKRQEIALSDAERRRRSAEQLRQVEERQAQQATQAAERRERGLEESKARAERAAESSAAPKPGGTPRPPSAGTPREEGLNPQDAAANARAHAERVERARQRKEAAQRRQAERAKPAASALPTPR